jgi:hypothetical protein
MRSTTLRHEAWNLACGWRRRDFASTETAQNNRAERKCRQPITHKGKSMNSAAAVKLDETATGSGGGSGPGDSRLACAGSWARDDGAPTCEGLGDVLSAALALPREAYLQLSKEVMAAIWTQPVPAGGDFRPSMTCVADLLTALNNGWAYNANEADSMFTFFGDIRPIARNGEFVGMGTQAPDGALVHDGRELVAWRERHWNTLRGPGRQQSAEGVSLRSV